MLSTGAFVSRVYLCLRERGSLDSGLFGSRTRMIGVLSIRICATDVGVEDRTAPFGR